MCAGRFVNGQMAFDCKSKLLLFSVLLAVASVACSSGKRTPPKSAWEVLAPLFQVKDGTNSLPFDAVIAGVLTPVRIGTSASHFYRTASRWPTNGHELGDFPRHYPVPVPTYAGGFEGIFIPNANDFELMKVLLFAPRADGGLDVAWPNQGTNISHRTLRISAPTNSVPVPQP